jgi:hypothetical protein
LSSSCYSEAGLTPRKRKAAHQPAGYGIKISNYRRRAINGRL